MQSSATSEISTAMHYTTSLSDSHGPFTVGYAPRENGGAQKRDANPAVDDDSEDSEKASPQPPVKKTKGRVKIKMEFIDNKLRRYTTFSKRKTGIMKKAYELSTLTGTQVMLLVASETGHVYTFATRKLQPMITSESGKALIQTCLNSPDPPPIAPGQQSDIDQRMNPTGFEEPDLTYAVNEEENKSPEHMGMKPIFINQNTREAYSQQSSVPQTLSVTTYIPPVSSSTSGSSSNKPSNISMQLPTGGFVLPGTQQLATPMGLLPIQQPGQQQGQTVYRFPNNQLVTIPGMTSVGNGAQGAGDASTTTTSLTNASGNNSLSSANSQGTVMYHTPQGVVYAAPSTVGNIPEGLIFNFPQTPTQLTIQDQQTGGHQYITIPVPVSIANSQVLQPVLTAADIGNDGGGGSKK